MSNDVLQTAPWQDVAPLLARWAIALVPRRDRTWDVLASFPGGETPIHEVYGVPFHALPQAIAAVAARCEAEETGEGAA